MNNEQLLVLAEQIRTESVEFNNDAERIGSFLKLIIEKLIEEGNSLTTEATNRQTAVNSIYQELADAAVSIRVELAAEATARTQAITTAVTNLKNDLLGGASSAFDSFKELQTLLENDAQLTSTLLSGLGNKVDKVAGKGLSTYDFNDGYKQGLMAAMGLMMPDAINSGKYLCAGDGEVTWEALPDFENVISIINDALNTETNERTNSISELASSIQTVSAGLGTKSSKISLSAISETAPTGMPPAADLLALCTSTGQLYKSAELSYAPGAYAWEEIQADPQSIYYYGDTTYFVSGGLLKKVGESAISPEMEAKINLAYSVAQAFALTDDNGDALTEDNGEIIIDL